MKISCILFVAIFFLTCCNNNNSTSSSDDNDTSKTITDKTKTTIEYKSFQKIWKSYDYYKNGQTEYIIETDNQYAPNSKEFYYFISNKKDQYDIPNPNIQFLEQKRHNGNEYIVSFTGNDKEYKLVFKNGKMECVDNNKIQPYTEVEMKKTSEFVGIFKRLEVFECIGTIDIENTSNNEIETYVLGTYACDVELRDTSIDGCQFTRKNPGNASNKKYVGKKFNIRIIKGLCGSEDGRSWIGDFANIFEQK